MNWIEIYSDSGSPAASRRAAQVLGEANSSNPQKLLIAPLLSKSRHQQNCAIL
ncbi:MAG: hypothetical protein R3C56_33060 [Pirellulaceae bacterium]